jgi:hypothetical protein
VQADPESALTEWDSADFALLVEEARRFRRVGAHALPDPEAFLREVVGGLFGVRSDAEADASSLAPWLPDGWRAMAIRRLRFHRALVDVEVVRGPSGHRCGSS